MRCSVLIADDERPAREKLRRFLEQSTAVASVFEARNGAMALDVVNTQHPDVVFLDIHMPGIDGIAAAESMVGEGGPRIVFVTAYDEHAIRAFELGAVDYLLKPFDRPRFETALSRVLAVLATEQTTTDVQNLRETIRSLMTRPTTPDRILVLDGERTRLLELKQIVRFDADRNYIRVTTENDEYRLRSTMAELEVRLNSEQFARINRSQILNLAYALELVPAGHGDVDVRLFDGSTVRLSRRYKDRVKGWA